MLGKAVSNSFQRQSCCLLCCVWLVGCGTDVSSVLAFFQFWVAQACQAETVEDRVVMVKRNEASIQGNDLGRRDRSVGLTGL